MAISELARPTDAPSSEPRAFRAAAHPSLTTSAHDVATARAAGFDVLGTTTLGSEAWWEGHGLPLRDRVEALRDLALDDGGLRAAIAVTDREIDRYERFGREYGYVFRLLRRGPSAEIPARRAGRSGR